METIIGTDAQKQRELQTSTQHACFILNRVIFPIARELRFSFDLADAECLSRYIRSFDAMRADYVSLAVNNIGNPALERVAEEVAQKQWGEVSKKYPLPNSGIVNDIVREWSCYVTITGESVFSAHAISNTDAIIDACKVYATEEDIAKQTELRALCDSLNSVFNGNGQLFGSYISIVDGQFFLIQGVSNYKPIIYGRQ